MKYRYIAIEGNIGAGKSTLANLLSEHYGTRLILEEFKDNNFLPKFYEDAERYAFPLELSFLADRYKQLKQELLNGHLFHSQVISDYLLVKCKLFAKVNLKEEEYDLFLRLFEIIDLQLPAPELLIYLHSPIDKLQENIKMRGREYEQAIPASYLQSMEEVYQEYLKHKQHRTLIIDMSQTDFLQVPAQLQQLIQFLDSEKNFDTHHLAFN